MSESAEATLLEMWQRLAEPSHFEHEDLIRYLQDHTDPRSFLHRQKAVELKASLKYLEFNDYGAYYKKCLRALQAINSKSPLL
jgi:hypothetical protein